jgi:hypothetical protein
MRELPPPRHRRLGEFRVAVWASSPLCRIDTSVSKLSVDDAARPGIDDEEHHRLFMLLLRAAGEGAISKFGINPMH